MSLSSLIVAAVSMDINHILSKNLSACWQAIAVVYKGFIDPTLTLLSLYIPKRFRYFTHHRTQYCVRSVSFGCGKRQIHTQ